MTFWQQHAHTHRAPAATHRNPLFHWLIGLGGVGLFFVAIVDASVVPLPLPGSTDLLLLVLVTHKPEQWWLFALIAIAGAIVGAYFSYRLAAKGGEALLQRYVPAKYTDRIKHWVQHNPVLAIGLPALLPPPIPLTPFVIAAGALHMPKRKFLVAFIIFRSARYLLEAWLGQHYGRHLIGLWRKYFGESAAPVIWTVVGLLVIGSSIIAWRMIRDKRRSAAPLRSEIPATGQ
jgi:membrane protein YqaA with SNARE-associated domain